MSGATPPQNRGTVLVGANWTNNGFVDIAGGSVRTGGGILGGAVVNSGQLSGHGLVTATATNELGGVFGGGGALAFAPTGAASFSNTAAQAANLGGD
jgi:hypothetical protein